MSLEDPQAVREKEKKKDNETKQQRGRCGGEMCNIYARRRIGGGVSWIQRVAESRVMGIQRRKKGMQVGVEE